MLDLTVILPLRNAEVSVASMVRASADLIGTMGGVGKLADPVSYEVLTVDQRSGDNTLAVVSLLHGQVPQLRTLQDVEPGFAVARAATVAKGKWWVLQDRAVEPQLLRWAIEQVAGGQRAASVPGEILAVDRNTGLAVLQRLNGGLVSAQQAVTRALAADGDSPASTDGPDRGLVDRTSVRLRAALGSLGLGSLDRPPSSDS